MTANVKNSYNDQVQLKLRAVVSQSGPRVIILVQGPSDMFSSNGVIVYRSLLGPGSGVITPPTPPPSLDVTAQTYCTIVLTNQ